MLGLGPGVSLTPAQAALYAALFQAAYLKPRPYALMPQELAAQLTMVTDAATKWFHDHSVVVQLSSPELEEITDQQVRDRIQGMQYSMDREIARLASHEYGAAWNWRFDDDWRERHNEWVESYNQRVGADPLFASHVKMLKVWRYDLSAMPWMNQYNLCVRWQQIWAQWKAGTGGASGDKYYDPVEAAAQLEAERVKREEIAQ